MTDTADKIAAAVAALHAARAPNGPIDALSPELAPADAAQAWAIHQALVARHGPVVGWKTGAPNPQAEPVLGEIAADTVLASPAEAPHARLRLWAVEAEIAVVFGEDLPARDRPYAEDEVLSAIATWHAAIEVLDTAFVEWASTPALCKLADRQSHGLLVVGPGVPARPDGALGELPVRLEIDGETVFAHTGGNTAGDPTRLLVALANSRSRTDRPVRKGDVVTTGSTTPFHRLSAGQRVVVAFDGLEPAALVVGA